MTKGRKEEVVSSVMRGSGCECWCLSGCLVPPAPPFLSSSPTKCLCKRLYGALKFLMKASLTGHIRIMLKYDTIFSQLICYKENAIDNYETVGVPLRESLDGKRSSGIKQNTFVAVQPSFYMTTACWCL